jgi:crotonobetaine/carnitine-CoA ligase
MIHPDIFPNRTDWVMGKLLETRARTHADKPFLQAAGTKTYTFREVDEIVNRVANGLAARGVSKGDNVLILMPNYLEFVFVWFALNKLGAVEVPVNLAYKGMFFEHLANNSQAKLIVIDTAYLDRLRESKDKLQFLEHAILFTRGEPDKGAPVAFSTSSYDELTTFPATRPDVDVKHSDVGSILYTSGTTGPSKGVMSSHAHMYNCAVVDVTRVRLTGDDVYYTCQPLFHGNAQVLTVVPALIVGCKAYIGFWFSASGWLREIRESGATVTNVQGAIMDFIYKQPPTDRDKDHKLRVIYGAPASPRISREFMERFGVKAIVQGYGQTEMGPVVFTSYDEFIPGSSGKPVDEWYEIRLVDPETDEPVAPGEPGEMIVRPRHPYALFSGYFGMPERTLAAYRNLWYHTGDMLRVGDDGNYYFVDRTKDKIRRRAENISSSDVENVLVTHPAVKEVAVVGIPIDIMNSEDEVKACIVLAEGETVSPEDLLSWAEDRMPYFCVPRFVEFVTYLPRTPTEKVQKQVLRESGVTPNTWDREKAGYQLKEELRKQRAKAARAAE